MKVTVAVLLAIVLVLAWQLNAENGATRQQQSQIANLTSKLADKTARETLESQEKCANMARRVFAANGGEPNRGGDTNMEFTNHFNSKLNKCFILVSAYSFKDDFRSIDLFDAIEGKRYANYIGHNICDVSITRNPRKCMLDGGRIWLDGNDTRTPGDFNVGFRGLAYGGGSGDENTQKQFMDHILPFMRD